MDFFYIEVPVPADAKNVKEECAGLAFTFKRKGMEQISARLNGVSNPLEFVGQTIVCRAWVEMFKKGDKMRPRVRLTPAPDCEATHQLPVRGNEGGVLILPL